MNDLNRLHYTILGDPATGAAAFYNVINALSADAAADFAADYVTTLDASASTAKKVLLANLVGSKIGSTTRDMSLTSDLAITGVGFKPRQVDLLMGFTTSADPASIGMDDGTSAVCLYNFNGTATGRWLIATTASIAYYVSSGNQNLLSVKTFDSDGFTLQCSKTGSPTGTPTIIWRARR